MAARNALGVCACPLCGFGDQEIREATNGKPYMICEECGMQLFARQAKSVRILRDRLKNHAPNHAPEEKHKPEKVQAVPVPAKPAPTPEPATPATELPTIFDVLDSLFAPKPKGEK